MSLRSSPPARTSRRSLLLLLLLVAQLLVVSAGALRSGAQMVDEHEGEHEEPGHDDDHAAEEAAAASPLLGSFQRHHDDPLQAGAPLTVEQCHGEADPSLPAAFYTLQPSLNITHEHTNETYDVLPAHPSCPNANPLAWSNLPGNTLVRQCGSLWISIGAVEAAAAHEDSPAIEAGVVIVVRDGTSGGFCATHLAKVLTAGHDDHDDDVAAGSAKASWRTWVYAMIGVMISCIVSLIGITFLMFHKTRVQSFLPELLALSSGTFIGSVIFSLLPETALEIGMKVEVTAVILGGILFGMLSESAIHGGVHFFTRRGRRNRRNNASCPASGSGVEADRDSSNCRVITVEMVRDSSVAAKSAIVSTPGASDAAASSPVQTDKEIVVQEGEACTDQSHAGHHEHAHAAAPAPVQTVRMHIDSGVDADADADTAATATKDDSPVHGDVPTDMEVEPINSQHSDNKKKEAVSHQDDGHGHAHGHGGHDPKHAAMINCLADALHNFIDGALIGWTTTVTITLHELPQELSDFALLLHAGLSTWQAALVNFAVSMTSVIGALIAIGVGEKFALEVLNVLPFSVGLFLYLALAVLVPTMLRVTGKRMWRVWAAFAIGIALMAVLLALPWEHGHGEGEGTDAHAGH